MRVAAKVDRAGGRWYRPSHSAWNAAGCSGDHFGGRTLSSRADFDVFVAGGGINGCGIGRDAAGRGFSVSLCDMDDLGSWTSSASTKLVHGGLRYLEQYRLRSVREALAEREVLWKSAPHLIRPMRFVLPHHRGLRPAWMLRLGLALYDRIGGQTRLTGARAVDLAQDPAGRPLKPQFRKGFEYSDCTVDDSRLVVMNARDAADKGAVIKTRTKFKRAWSRGGVWEIVTQDTLTGVEEVTTARLIVNATGPWADLTLASSSQSAPARSIRLVQGSHVVVPGLFDHERSYLFQGSDRRVVFAIPYQQSYTLIGTTDVDYQGDPADTAVQPQEVSYLCEAVNRYLERPVREGDVVWSYSGLRPIYDDGADAAQDASRDYVLRQHREAGGAPLVSVFGGKITTYRRLAEEAMKLIELHLGRRGPAWTKGSVLPGGDFDASGFDDLLAERSARYPFLTRAQVERMLRSYGTMIDDVVGDAASSEDMGEDFGFGLTAREVGYLQDREWARTVDDILWRRTKLGLLMSEEQVLRLGEWMERRPLPYGQGAYRQEGKQG